MSGWIKWTIFVAVMLLLIFMFGPGVLMLFSGGGHV